MLSVHSQGFYTPCRLCFSTTPVQDYQDANLTQTSALSAATGSSFMTMRMRLWRRRISYLVTMCILYKLSCDHLYTLQCLWCMVTGWHVSFLPKWFSLDMLCRWVIITYGIFIIFCKTKWECFCGFGWQHTLLYSFYLKT